MKQLNLLEAPPKQFGGSFDQRHRTRILSSKKPIHLTLKSHKSFKLFQSRDKIRSILFKQANKLGVNIYSWSIQQDHIHLSIKIHSRETYKKWIRATTGLIAKLFKKGIWKSRPFTRVLSGFGREFQNLNNYIFRNEMEVFRIWSYDRSKSVEQYADTTKARIIYPTSL